MNAKEKLMNMPVISNKGDNSFDQPFDNSTTNSIDGTLSRQNNLLNDSKKSLTDEELRKAVQKQLEFYFSRENLARDTYLLSQMDSDQYVQISTVANFEQVKRLTTDRNLILEVLRESSSVQVDESGQRVRPNHKRSVLILREIPESTSIKDVENLFAGKNCPKFVSCEFAHNNSWYVTFETDEDAQRAYCYIREEIKTFPSTGTPIMARIKAKPIIHSVASASYKNGFRPSTAANTNADSNRCNLNSQPFESQQNFTYANVPPQVNYQNSRIYPPFYPPTMLQAWTPPASACYDLSAVFVANGLAPHAFGGLNRHPYHSIKNSAGRGKTHICKRNVVYNANNNVSSQTPNGSSVTSSNENNLNARYNSRQQQSLSKTLPPQINHNSPVNRNAFYSQNSPNSSEFIKTNDNFSKANAINNSNYQAKSPNNSSCETLNSNTTLNGLKSIGKNRKTKRREENGDCSFVNNTSRPDNKPLSTVVSAPAFDLEASAFPPLPCHLSQDEECSKDAKEQHQQCSSLADVVKGTIKHRGSKPEESCLNTPNLNETSNDLESNLSENSKDKSHSKSVDDSEADEILSVSYLTITSQENDHATLTIPAKSLNSLEQSSEGEDVDTESIEESEFKICTTVVLNGNDSSSRHSESVDDNDHSTKSNSPVTHHELNTFDTVDYECNGHLSTDKDSSQTNDHSTSELPQLISSNQNTCKKLTYSEIAQRSKEKNADALEAKETHQESNSSNSSTCSSRTSLPSYCSSSGRAKLVSSGSVFCKEHTGCSVNDNCNKKQSVIRSQDFRENSFYNRNIQRNLHKNGSNLNVKRN